MPGPNKNASMSAPAPLVSTSQPIKVQHQSSLTEHKVSGQGQGQGNGGYFSSKEIAKVKEVKDSGKGTLQQSSPVHQQHQQQTNPLGSSGSAQIEARESREEESKGGDPRGSAELSRNGDELQSRVKKAIEKSMDVIKKFKLIKDNMQ